MAQIFYVHCPECRGKFPCHPELWDIEYDLLCPFCQHSFPQEASPRIITGTGEQRAGRRSGGTPRDARDESPSRGPGPDRRSETDPTLTPESM